MERSIKCPRDTNSNKEQRMEQLPLLPTAPAVWKSKFKTRCCMNSKAAILILCWNTFISILVTMFLNLSMYVSADVENSDILRIGMPSIFSILAFHYLFYPLAGCLADTRCGRYKTVVYSLWFTFCLTLIATIVIVAIQIIYEHTSLSHKEASIVHMCIVIILIVALFPNYISFNANVIQFGMDQLYDSPSEDSVLFVHWFIVSTNAGLALIKTIVTINLRFMPITIYMVDDTSPLYAIVYIMTVILLGGSLCVTCCRRRWFLIDTGSRNPYKLVYRVVKFAVQHKTPIHRSAFTYCEDELPSRMDLGKEKYGGPFTTEQVEDVKAFLGLLCLLLTLGPVFITDIARNQMLPAVAQHFKKFKESTYNFYYSYNLILVCLPDVLISTFALVYICLIRPFFNHYTPGMLRRIGLGMIMLLLSAISTLTVDTVGHSRGKNNVCLFTTNYTNEVIDLDLSGDYLALPTVFNALGYTLFYTACYELICSQSPHAMKGLLVGTFFTIKGVFQLIGATAVLIPFSLWHFETWLPSCGFVYYLINILVALTGLVAYTWVARRYQYRQRDEPDNIYRYAEEYYDRAQDDRFHNSYDYTNDYDNLNVHTIN